MRFTYIPLGLVLFRAMLIPVLPAISFWYGNAATTMVVIAMILGFGSDILDGVIARKLRCDTDLLRRLDSQTDAFFWLSMLLCIAINQPAWIISQRYAIGSLLGLEAVCYLTSFLRFGRETCTHSWLSKAWGISLCAAFALVLLNHPFASAAWKLCVLLGILSQLEVIAILCLLPHWQRDIPTVLHVLRSRNMQSISKE